MGNRISLIVAGAAVLLLSACAPISQADRAAANRVVVTGTDSVPGQSYRVLGVVRIDGGDIYEDCTSSDKLAVRAVQQYGSAVDAIIAFRSTNSNCSPTALGNVCYTGCEGTAVQFSPG